MFWSTSPAGPAMTLSEVEILMQELGRHVDDDTQILFGTSVDGRMGNRLSVTLISSLATEEERMSAPAKPASLVEPEPMPVAAPTPAPILRQWRRRLRRSGNNPKSHPSWRPRRAVFADELIQAEEPAAELSPEPTPIADVPEEPVIEEARRLRRA